MSEAKGKGYEAWMPVSKAKATLLLEALKSVNPDQTSKELVKELEDILKYWKRVESITMSKNPNFKTPVNRDESSSPKRGFKLTGKAAEIVLKTRGK